MAQRVTITWQGQQLGAAFQRLADMQPALLWLDRRVNPQLSVNLQLTDVPLTQALSLLAERHALAVVEVDGVLYVGPRRTARGLATLIQRARADLAAIPAGQRRKWLRESPVSWPRLSQPSKLLESALEQESIRLEGGHLVPHDLWPACELPSLALVDRVVLLLAGFDLTCEISPDGKVCHVVPIEFPLPNREHNSLLDTNRSTPLNSRTKTRKQFSLRLENKPVGHVMEQLAQQLKLELDWDEASLTARNRSRETLVSCQVTNADLDDLLQAILGPAGLEFTRVGQKIAIRGVP